MSQPRQGHALKRIASGSCRNLGAPFEVLVRTGDRRPTTRRLTMSSTLSYRQSPAPAAAEVSTATCTPRERITRSLLGYGVIAGPIYIAVSVAQGLVRD